MGTISNVIINRMSEKILNSSTKQKVAQSKSMSVRATSSSLPLNPTGGEIDRQRNLCRVETRDGSYGGYKKEILTENLSGRDNAFLVCGICKGIMKGACLTGSGEQFCSCCEVQDSTIKRTITFTKLRNPSKQTPNVAVRKMVDSLQCSCPLVGRGCKWSGTLKDCEDHLDTCGYVNALCKLKCGIVIQRNELKLHEEKCPLLIAVCKHCKGELKLGDMTTHLGACPKMEILCEMECSVVMCREDMAQHLKQECGLVKEVCKLGCKMTLTRNELTKHMRDTCVLRYMICEHCKKYFRFCDISHHLEMCPKIKVSCELKCGVVLQREELKIHEKRCPLCIVTCEHCKKYFRFCDMTHHLEMCPKMKVSCELKCGLVMCREDVTQHVEQDCVEKEIECPFVKYKCVGLMKRKNLRNHLDDKRMEHLELKMDTMKECMLKESKITAKQKEKISTLNMTIETMSSKMKLLEEEVEILTKLTKAIKLLWRITEVPEKFTEGIQQQFQVVGYNLEFYFCTYSSNLQIRVIIQTGLNDKLEWPFKAEFITHLSSQSNPGNIKKYKSKMLRWRRECLYSPFFIATFSKDEFLEHFINGEAEFEIFVIIL